MKYLLSFFVLFFLVSCGGKRKIDRPEEPEIIPTAQVTSAVLQVHPRVTNIEVDASYMRVRLKIERYFKNFDLQVFEGLILISLKDGKVISPFYQTPIGNAICEQSVELDTCTKLKLVIVKNPFRMIRKCERTEGGCIKYPSQMEVSLERVDRFKMSVNFNSSSNFSTVGVFDKWKVTVVPGIENDKEKFSFVHIIVSATSADLKIDSLFLSEVEQLVPHLPRDIAKNIVSGLKLVRYTDQYSEIYYTGFNQEDASENSVSLKFLFRSLIHEPSIEREGLLTLERIQ